MRAIPWEDKHLTACQRAVLTGSLLGDGRLECRAKSGSARFRVHHADSQRALLDWKYNIFHQFVRRKPWWTDWYDMRYERSYRSWFFHTETSLIFAELYRRFYGDGCKRVPPDIIDDLEPLAVAVWIADDGCHSNDTLILNTQSFTLLE